MKNIRDLAQTLSPKTLVVLDIDSTLVLTHKRNQAILRHFSESSNHPQRSLFKQAECHAFEYGYYQALERLGIELTSAVAEEVSRFWREHFFSHHFLHHDIIHDGALEFVEQLQHRWIPHVYLTGRPHPTMWQGTLETLQKFGFSTRENNLFLKPQAKDIDELFKSQKMHELKVDHSEIIFIDNEPRVLNQIHRDHPEVQLVFVDTCHSPNVVPPSSALKIKDFRDIVNLLK